MPIDEKAFEQVLYSRHWAGAKYLRDFVKQYEHAKASKPKPPPLTEEDRQGAVQIMLAAFWGRDFANIPPGASDFVNVDLMKLAFTALNEHFELRRKP